MRWHIQRNTGSLTLSRLNPARFDLAVETFLPRVGKLRLAQQIRQDIWRNLQTLRGFAPVVHIEDAGDMVKVMAGGQVDGKFPLGHATARIETVLNNTQNRERWLRNA